MLPDFHAQPCLTSSGRAISPEAARVIGTIDERLSALLCKAEGVPQYLIHGPDFSSLSTWESNRKNQGSRHDHLVAFLCNVGVKTVRSARAFFAKGKKNHTCTPAPATTRGHTSKEQEADQLPDMDDVTEQLVPCASTLAGVRGHYVKASHHNAKEHAIALVLGRLYLFVEVQGLSVRALHGFQTQLLLAGAPLGQKHHSWHTASAFCGIAARLCLKATAKSFWAKPPNLQHPSTWRLTFDGVTIRNGATTIILLVVFTNAEGDIVVKLVGILKDATNSTGEDCARALYDLIDSNLALTSGTGDYVSTEGLPLYVPAASQDQAINRAELLTSIICDMAYSGNTGNKADAFLAKLLRVHGLIGRDRRIGMADMFHCYDICGAKSWNFNKGRNESDDADGSMSESSSTSSRDSTGSAGHGTASLDSWVRLCRRLRKALGRGHGNAHLVRGYKDSRIPGRPQITIPGQTRKIVYAGKMLRQSFRHYEARYRGLWYYATDLRQGVAKACDLITKCEQELSTKHPCHGAGPQEAQRSSLRQTLHKARRDKARYSKLLQKVTRLGTSLANGSQILQPLLVHGLFSTVGGFLCGARAVQETCQVFFPLHVMSASVWWNLRHWGEHPPKLAREKEALAAPQGTEGQLLSGFRCVVCGLLKKSAQELFEHSRSCHCKRDGLPNHAAKHHELLNPARVLRPRRCFCDMQEVPRVSVDSKDPFWHLALRQEGAVVPSLYELSGVLNILNCLFGYVVFPADKATLAMSQDQEALANICAIAPEIQDCCRFFLVVLRRALWRAAPMWWAFSLGYMASGRWQRCSVEAFEAPGLMIVEGLKQRTLKQARNTFQAIQKALSSLPGFFMDLAHNFQQDVLQSHGNHIPQTVRDSSAALFWLPEILSDSRLINQTFQTELAENIFWQPRMSCLPRVLAYVANQVESFEWPNTEIMMRQYKELMTAWAALFHKRNGETCREAWRPCHGAGPLQFQWKWWWKQSHVNVKFRPPVGCEAAFALYHFTGMFGISEAYAESVASLLKRYMSARASHLGTDRVIEKVILSNSGLKGDGSDDIFILRCWADFFGGLNTKRFRFHNLRPSKRQCRFPVCKGSKVINTFRKKAQNSRESNLISARFLKNIPLLARQNKRKVIHGARAWRKALCREA